jgi:ABC-2 type transport system ATP-binding protein
MQNEFINELTVQTNSISKWYGNVLGVSEISVKIGKGIHGLLGPNGAGKSTFLKLISGQLKTNIGDIKIFGEDIQDNYTLFNRIGLCPENDSFYKGITGWEFILFSAKLLGFKNKTAIDKAETAIERVGLIKSKDKLISEYSLGMRQRIKLASSIIHEPELLILDEPLRGIDPLWRVKVIELIRDFEKRGKTVIVSSHILSEIEDMTDSIILIHQGKIFAQGKIEQIRELLDTHPHQVSIKSDNIRLIGEKIVNDDHILNINFNDRLNRIIIETNNRDRFFNDLNGIIVENKLNIEEISSPDDNLQAVFDYLIGR